MSHSEHEILLEVLNCTLKISKQLGTAPYAMYFESVTGKPVISSDETFGGLVNILESGYDMFIGQRTWSDLCADISREKELKSHENLRTFSIDMLLSLSTLCQKAGSWEKVFTIIENHLQHRLVPKKFRYNNNGEALSDICSSILVQATSQFAKVMFESAFDIVLLLSYLLNISAQVSFHCLIYGSSVVYISTLSHILYLAYLFLNSVIHSYFSFRRLVCHSKTYPSYGLSCFP